MNVRLVKPTIELQDEYMSFYEEWGGSGEEFIPWVIGKDPTDFGEMVKELQNAEKGIGLRPGWVPDTTYWLVNSERRVLGAVNIRHDLTEHLRNVGGHIGYGIRPSERKKGFATKVLELSLVKMKALEINKVLVVCDEVNVGSEKTILNNGGVRDEDYVDENGNVVRRFWIEIS
ncbi:GNAT family N-acetyltransferase [Sporosarcina limicola]|uniref:Acetyltransferase n=1 Tax=Sporosarcina limicola TaxID=34101 RepID=A0A927R5I6_9BACL|nr:GNAT family N-acetyltransferase [Sporosarcina limicola]MBE1556083.1 putative acetyltransferase [Sporosarcina limicola]